MKHALALNSCTSALHLAIQANNITKEVILPSFTFVASANSIITAGAKPVFVDIDYNTCNIDPAKIEAAITKDTQAIMPVHYAGQSCDMEAIMKIANEHNLKIIEDSAETIGGTFNGQKTGSFGEGCFSFYPTKNMTTGEGGVLTTNDDKVYNNAKSQHAHGLSTTAFERERIERPWVRAAEFSGYNFRMCDILAAIGVVQLKKVDKMNEKRISHSKYLTNELKNVEGIVTPTEDSRAKHVYQMYTLKVKEGINRNKFVMSLREKGIGASVHFDPPVHVQPRYKQYAHNDLKVTEKIADTIVTLPMYPQLNQEELDYIVTGVKEALQ